MKKVFLDTNFLLDLLKFKVRLEDVKHLLQNSVKFFVFSSSIEELKKLAENKGNTGSLAKLALELIRLEGMEIVESEKSVDEAFLSIEDKNTIIATNDSKLRKRLRERGMKTIYLRGRKKLEVG